MQDVFSPKFLILNFKIDLNCWVRIFILVVFTEGTEVSDSVQHTKEMYEKHVKRLMFILDQEQQARSRVETKLEEARVNKIIYHQSAFLSINIDFACHLTLVFQTLVFIVPTIYI